MRTKIKKTVLITGATTGFGTYLARAFARTGFNIVATGRKKEKLLALQKELSNDVDVNCSIVEADISNKDGVQILNKVLETKEVDILINNAAINPELSSGNVATEIEAINSIILTNTSAAISLCTGAFEYFLTKGGGTIININSMAGLVGSNHEPLYAASKFGLRGFSESIKGEWIKHGVRMIDVYSGAIGTGMSARRSDAKSLIDPKELAEFIVGLCKTDTFFVREFNVQRTRK